MSNPVRHLVHSGVRSPTPLRRRGCRAGEPSAPRRSSRCLLSAAAVAGGGAFALAATSNAASVHERLELDGLPGAGHRARQQPEVHRGPARQHRTPSRRRGSPTARPSSPRSRSQQEASGCEVGESAQGVPGGAPERPRPGGRLRTPKRRSPRRQPRRPRSNASAAAPADNAGGDAATGEQVCNGSTVTLSGEGGAPAASSNQFPAGTKLKVTNLDNNKSTTVEVTSVSGSCALLNNAAFEQVREPGKFLIRRALIEKVG